MAHASLPLSSIVFAASLATSLPPTGAEEWRLRPDGIGPLKIGMSFDEVRRALGPELERTPDELLASPGCDYLPVPGRPGLNLMFIDDVLRRVDLAAGAWQTERGIRLGSSAREAKQAYRRLESAPREFTETGAYLTFRPRGAALALRFVTADDGSIDTIHAGDAQALGYAEACL